MYECKKSDQYDTADIPTYEEVAKYRRQPNDKYRLVVLVGKLFSLFFFFFLPGITETFWLAQCLPESQI